MSTTIDQRVVEMRFDNKQFEQNANTSISTLEKLKQKLNLSGASKGLENINAAAKNNNLSALGNAASTVASRFSAMEIVGVTALANLTNSAVNAGKRMVSALTIEPVKTGFNEYELKMDSVKTIMASTGESVERVNELLDELNKYSDETIYSFSDMTQNIGKFTNAGVELEDAVMAIKGISNEAAVSGANANEASRAMYNFAQALSAGHVKLIDWKSIENANMATKEFKQELINTAVELGTVTESADGMYETLDGNSFNAIKNFNDVLQDQWMTSDVLIETLKRYADENTKIGAKAKAAAQDVTKLTQVFDIAKETAQSGWARTWELMFGDINQAKAFFTPISNAINSVIDKMSNFRNSILEGALGTPFQGLSDTFKKFAEAGKEVTDTTKDMEDAINRVLGGEFGNGQERWDKLTKAGYDWAAVQNKVNEKLGSSVRHTSKLADAQKDLETSQGLAVEQMLKMTDAQLMNLGFSKEEIDTYRALEKEIAKTGHTIGEVIDNPEIMSGRNLLIEAFKNLGSALSNVMSIAKKAWQEIFPPKAESAIERGSKGLYSIIISLHTFARRMNDLSQNKETIDKLARTFKGLFAAIDIVTTVVAGPFKIAFKILKAILGAFNLDILDFTAMLGDGIVGFRNFIKECNFLEKGIQAIIPIFSKMVDAVRNWIDGMKEAENIPQYIVQGLVNGLKNGVKSVVNGVINLAKTVITSFCKVLRIESPSKKFFEIGGYIIQGLVNGLKNGFSTVWNVIKNFGSKCIEVLGNIDWGAVLTVGALAGFMAIAYKFASAFNKVANAFDGLGEMFEDIGKGVKKALNSFSGLMKGLKFKFMAEGIKDLAISVAILVGAVIALTFVETEKLWPAVGVIVALVGILGLLAWAMTKISDMSMSFNFKDGFQSNGGFGGALLALGATLLILIGVVKIIGNMDPTQAQQGFKGLIALMGILVGVFAAFSLTTKFGGNVDKIGGMFLKLSIAMILLIGVIKLVSKLDGDELFKGAIAMTGFVLFVKGLVKATRSAGNNINKIGGMLIKISFAMILMVGVVKLISKLKWDEMAKGAVGMVGFTLFVKLLVKAAKGAGKNIGKVGGLLLGMSVAMVLMVGVIKLISTMKWTELAKGITGVLALTLIMTLMVKMVKTVGKNSAKMTGTLLAMSLAIAILAGIAVLLSMVDTKHLVKGIIAVGLLAGIVSGMVLATRGAKNCMANLIVMTSAIILLAGAIALLCLIDGNKLKTSAQSLGLVMTTFAVLIASTKMMKSSKTLTKSMLTMLGVVAVLALIVAGLSFINPTNVLGNVTALSVLMLAFSASLVILSKAGGITKTVTKNLLPMLGIVAGLALILGVLGALKVEASLQSAIALGVLLTALSASMVILDHVGNISSTVIGKMAALTGVVALLAAILGVMSYLDVGASIGSATALAILLVAMAFSMEILDGVVKVSAGVLGGMYALVGVVVLLAAILGVMSYLEVDASLETALSLSVLLLSMSVSLGILAAVSPIAAGALVSVGILAAVIAALSALFFAIGALLEWQPSIAEFVEKALPFLEMIGKGIGAFFGGMAAGFTDALAESLPHLGEQLSLFMEKVQPFVDSASKIDGGALLTGIGGIAGAVLALTAADFLTGLAALGGGVPFEATALCLSNFAKKLQPFIEGIKTIDASSVESAKSLASVILALTIADVISGIASLFGIQVDFSSFGDKLESFGKAVVKFSDIVSDNIDAGAIEAAQKAGLLMCALAKDIPRTGSTVVKWFVGEQDLGVFGDQLRDFGKGLAKFSTSITENGGINTEAIEAAQKAGMLMSALAKDIPKNGSTVVKWFAGEQNLATFGDQLKTFGKGVVKFSNYVVENGGINEEAVTAAQKAGVLMATLANDLPKNGSTVVKWFAGEKNLGTFGEQLKTYGQSLSTFGYYIGNINETHVESAKNAGLMMVELQKAIPEDKLFKNETHLDEFGEVLSEFGGYVYDFYTEICLVDTLKMKNTGEGIEKFVSIAKGVNNVSFSGVDNLKGAFDKFAEMKLDEFKEKFSEGATAAVNRVRQLAEDLAGIKEYADKSGVETLRSAIAIANAVDIAKFKELFADGLSTYTGRVQSLAKGISSLKDISIDNAATRNLNTAVSTLAGMPVQQMIETFNGSVDDAVSDMGTLVRGINKLVDLDTSGTESFKSAVTTLAETGVSKLIETFNGSADDLEMSGAKMVKNVVSGLKSNEKDIGTSLSGGIASAVQGANNYYTDFYSAGSYLATGFANGITANSYAAAAQARAMAKAAVLAAEEALGIASPSKVFGEIGNFAGLGFVNKLREYGDKAYDASAEMADSARSGLKDSINKVLGLINGTIDAQPTIRPVLDLSGVESGVGAIGRMFNTEASIGVTSNLRAIDSSMSHYGQNGGNNELISEFKKLRTELRNAGGTTNYINGITYDDGSNISSAVETLVRAARIERRS